MRCYLFTSSCSLAAIAFVAFLGNGISVAGDEQSSNTPINVGVYYESLCPDSMRWIRTQLLANYDALKDYIHVNFVPFGKATFSKPDKPETGPWQFSCQHGPAECEENMAHACGINAIQNEEQAGNVQRLTVALVGCAMSTRYPPSGLALCAGSVGLSETTQTKIRECIGSNTSKDLLAMYGKKTEDLSPPLTFVPTITINGGYTKEIQNQAFNNFLKFVCEQLQGTKPSQCNHV